LKKVIALTIIFLCLNACSSTIGNKFDPTKIVFKVGATTKSQVAETLGLPASVDYSPDKMQELWLYQKTTHLKKIYFVTPTGISHPNPFYDVTVFFRGGKPPENTASIYIFDTAGILSDIQRP
jgi:hypothetical protein